MRSRPHSRLLSLIRLSALAVWVAGCAAEEAGGDRGGGEASTPQASSESDLEGAPVSGPASRGLQPAPDFTLDRVDGGTLQLSSLRGKVVLLDFWATWCAPCRRAIPHLNKLHSTYGEDGFEIVGISVDQPRGTVAALDLVRAFMARTTMKYPNVMGSLSVVTAYGGIRSIPTAFLIDREGRIRHRYVGYQPPHVLDRDVKAVLAEGVDGTASI